MIHKLPIVGLAVLAAALAWSPAFAAASAAQVPAAGGTQTAPTIAEQWVARAEQGDRAAQAHLCELNFGGEGQNFDAQKAATWCHAAAEAGDARGMWRMGLLSLAGVGARKDLDAAARLCGQAAADDATIPAGFCLAAVAAERARTGAATTEHDRAAKPRADTAPDGSIAHWRDLADRGDRTAAAHLCDAYFDAGSGAFDAGRTADWCRRAAGYGNANAMRRLGLMRFWGVGMEKSSPGAEALCVEAQARDAAVSSGFCAAAVKAERASAEAQLSPARPAYPAPWPAASGLASVPNALGPDRALETVHSAADGLHYSCRDLIDSARYGLQLDGLMFGRSILQFDASDYAALDAGAADCATSIAPYDHDGSQRSQLANFRTMLPLLKKRQQDLSQHAAQTQAEKQQQDREYADRSRNFLMVVAVLSQPQNQCIDAVRRAWLARRFSPAAHSLEIRSVATGEVNGKTVVFGDARLIGNPLEDPGTASKFTCTFDDQSQTIVSTSVVPAAATYPAATTSP